jgi:hypothetical protein
MLLCSFVLLRMLIAFGANRDGRELPKINRHAPRPDTSPQRERCAENCESCRVKQNKRRTGLRHSEEKYGCCDCVPRNIIMFIRLRLFEDKVPKEMLGCCNNRWMDKITLSHLK